MSENKRRIELRYSWIGYCPRLVINLHKLDRNARLFETDFFVGDYKHISRFTSSGLWRLFKKWKYLLIENIIYVQVCYCSYDHMQVLRIDKILLFCDIFFFKFSLTVLRHLPLQEINRILPPNGAGSLNLPSDDYILPALLRHCVNIPMWTVDEARKLITCV